MILGRLLYHIDADTMVSFQLQDLGLVTASYDSHYNTDEMTQCSGVCMYGFVVAM
jgi:hypothetical protein